MNVSDNTQTVSGSTSEEYKDLFHQQYKCDKSVLLGDGIEHIQLVNNRLICTLRKGITICSAETLQTLQSLTFDTISDATCSEVTDTGCYIVGSYRGGLCEVDSHGKQLCMICPGVFISVNIKDDAVYSYDWGNKRVVCVKRCVGGVGWERVSEVELQYGGGVIVRNVFGCIVTRDHIYMSWRGKLSGKEFYSVSKHDLSGRQVDRYGSYSWVTDSGAGLLGFPLTSGVDRAGRMLVCDGWNRVLVCSDEDEWRVVGGIWGVEGRPQTATVSNNTVWVGCNYPNYLHKYVVS